MSTENLKNYCGEKYLKISFSYNKIIKRPKINYHMVASPKPVIRLAGFCRKGQKNIVKVGQISTPTAGLPALYKTDDRIYIAN
ncbi:MAG: hypothetical protein PVG74_21465 [Desulfobacterales bacterium]|jgi:hypothetical protein